MSILSQTDTLESTILKMADGVSGALEALGKIVNQGPDIDPQMEYSGIGHLFLLDEWEIYGLGIFILFNDKCKGDVRKFLLLLRATQLGKYPKSKIKELASDQHQQVTISDEVWREVDYVVCRELPGFKDASSSNGSNS